jgi:hypothetical protein
MLVDGTVHLFILFLPDDGNIRTILTNNGKVKSSSLCAQPTA